MSALALTALAAAAVAPGHGHEGHEPAAAAPTPAAASASVSMGFVRFAPARVDVLTGDTVTWRNLSARTHTVDGDDFGSGPIPSTTSYARRFEHPGVVAYLCRRHPSMDGEVGVWTVLLDRPEGAGRPGTRRTLTGRTALPPGTPVPVEADSGAGFAPAGTAVTDAAGGLALEVAPRVPTTYRAVAEGAGPAVGVDVLDRAVRIVGARRRGRRITVTARVTPSSPGTPAVLQLRIPERFGWWPVARAKVDRSSRVRFRVALRRRLRARVVLTLPDGATVVAASPVARP